MAMGGGVRVGVGGEGGSKVCLMTTLNHRPKKISSRLLLISSNDVPAGWRALCQPYCHYDAPCSFLPLFWMTEWMFHATKFASTSLPPYPPPPHISSQPFLFLVWEVWLHILQKSSSLNVKILSVIWNDLQLPRTPRLKSEDEGIT